MAGKNPKPSAVRPSSDGAVIELGRALAARLRSEAKKTPNTEVCGFIGGRAGVGCSVYPVRNAAADPARRFVMDAAEQIAVFKQLRARGEDLFAIYHSHPGAPAVPSARDIEGLGYPRSLYVIISLTNGGGLALRAWRYRGGRMHEVALTVTD